jgi:lipoic acid synthetase
VIDALCDLRAVGVDLVTIGQYLRPTAEHLEVARFVKPATFERYRQRALELGFQGVASGPLVRSSFRAAEVAAQSLHGAGRKPSDGRFAVDGRAPGTSSAK